MQGLWWQLGRRGRKRAGGITPSTVATVMVSACVGQGQEMGLVNIAVKELVATAVWVRSLHTMPE